MKKASATVIYKLNWRNLLFCELYCYEFCDDTGSKVEASMRAKRPTSPMRSSAHRGSLSPFVSCRCRFARGSTLSPLTSNGLEGSNWARVQLVLWGTANTELDVRIPGSNER